MVVDLTEVSFIDSTFLAALVSAQKRLTGQHGYHFGHLRRSELVKIFEITGLDRLFAIHANCTR